MTYSKVMQLIGSTVAFLVVIATLISGVKITIIRKRKYKKIRIKCRKLYHFKIYYK